VSPENPLEIIESVAARIAELRRGAGLTQAQVAERLGMTVSNYQRIEHGLLNTSVKTLVRVANAIGVKTVDFFMPRTSSQKKKRGRPRKDLQ
jgi:UDP-N-acetylglucosamine 1-carboxyvinyltransferase